MTGDCPHLTHRLADGAIVVAHPRSLALLEHRPAAAAGTDYFAGRAMTGPILRSRSANQLSAVSLIGAPAVALRPGGVCRGCSTSWRAAGDAGRDRVLLPMLRALTGARSTSSPSGAWAGDARWRRVPGVAASRRRDPLRLGPGDDRSAGWRLDLPSPSAFSLCYTSLGGIADI
jgi:hypothetical protein